MCFGSMTDTKILSLVHHYRKSFHGPLAQVLLEACSKPPAIFLLHLHRWCLCDGWQRWLEQIKETGH